MAMSLLREMPRRIPVTAVLVGIVLLTAELFVGASFAVGETNASFSLYGITPEMTREQVAAELGSRQWGLVSGRARDAGALARTEESGLSPLPGILARVLNLDRDLEAWNRDVPFAEQPLDVTLAMIPDSDLVSRIVYYHSRHTGRLVRASFPLTGAAESLKAVRAELERKHGKPAAPGYWERGTACLLLAPQGADWRVDVWYLDALAGHHEQELAVRRERLKARAKELDKLF